MATISPTWSFEVDSPLVGVGLDVEEVGRFARLVLEENPLPLVFSAHEAERLARQPAPARAYCAAFSCKEALLKALGEPYDPRDCEVLDGATGSLFELRLAPRLIEETGVGRALAHVSFNRLEECVAMVYALAARPHGQRAAESTRGSTGSAT